VRLAGAQSVLLPGVCNVVVERQDLVRGFQHAKDQYVPITEDELESLQTKANRSIDLKEFIPLASVDPVYFEDTHYLGADKGGEKPYRLLADAMGLGPTGVSDSAPELEQTSPMSSWPQ
jgi:DNA end-binding protein Ku